ncbi:MAG: hypothetical protein QOH49_845 [Acidobacteriota bacterium]|jgi:hypothetical protein|nr:hypothetical protein [Acidobacteriota bacterium]
MSKASAIRVFTICLLTLSFAFPPEVLGAGIEKRVVFPKGKTTVSYRGKLPLHEGNYDAYFFPSKKMQTLTVKLTCDDPEAFLAIYETKELGPDEDIILGFDQRAREWTGRLPVTGEYSVQVYDASENGINRAAYTLEISLR